MYVKMVEHNMLHSLNQLRNVMYPFFRFHFLCLLVLSDFLVLSYSCLLFISHLRSIRWLGCLNLVRKAKFRQSRIYSEADHINNN